MARSPKAKVGGACEQVKLLKDAERQGAEQARPRRPRALVLGPTRELTDQILGVAKSIAHHAKFRSACVNGGAQLFAWQLPGRCWSEIQVYSIDPACSLQGSAGGPIDAHQ